MLKENYKKILSDREEVFKKTNMLKNSKEVREYNASKAEVKRLEYKISKKQTNELIIKRERVIEKIKLLKRRPAVRDYSRLKSKLEKLDIKKAIMYKAIKIQEFDNCDHILISDNDDFCCLKCGLDTRVLDDDKYYLDENKSIMYNYLWDNDINGKKIICDLELAKAIYKRIKEVHPNIDDKTIKKYFEIALDNIKNIRVNKERQKNRAKRLHLSHNFNN